MALPWNKIAFDLKRAGTLFVSFVVACQKGSPGVPGAWLVLSPNGSQCGTIGGGIMEKQAIERGLQRMKSNSRLPELVRLRHRDPGAPGASGLICGGEQVNVEMVLTLSEHDALLKRVAGHEARESRACVEVDSTGIRLSAGPEEEHAEILRTKGDGSWRCFFQLVNQRRVAIFGGGHCGVALACLLEKLDYSVTVVECRKDVFTLHSLPTNVTRVHAPCEEAAERLRLKAKTDVVVMTHSMHSDADALAAVLRHGFLSVGLMGTPKKWSRIQHSLKDRGFRSAELAKVRVPVGLAINSDTPWEIAVSIAAEILRKRSMNGPLGFP